MIEVLHVAIFVSLIACVKFAERHRNPIYILPGYYLFVSAYTIIGTHYFSFSKDVPFQFGEIVSEQELNDAILAFFVASISFAAGACIHEKASRNIFLSLMGAGKKVNSIQSRYILIPLLLTVLFAHLSVGISALYERDSYLVSEQSFALARIVYSILLPLTSALIGLERKKGQRYMFLATLVIFAQGTNSRSTALVPIIYLLTRYLRTNKIDRGKVLVACMFSVFLSFLAITLRNGNSQGIIGNVLSLLKFGLDFNLLIYSINYLTSYSVFTTAITLSAESMNIKNLLLSITPMPSSLTNIDLVVESQRLNQYAPYTAIGFVGQGGLLFLSLFYASAGALYARIFVIANRYNILVRVVVVILFFMFSILTTQYNLRGAMRLVYYSLLIVMLCGLIHSFFRFLKTSRKS